MWAELDFPVFASKKKKKKSYCKASPFSINIQSFIMLQFTAES